MDAEARSLKDELAAALPHGLTCKIRYIRSPPQKCDPLFSPPPGHEAEKTRLASHFLTISVKRADNDESPIDVERGAGEAITDVLVFGIEVLVYTAKHLTTVFVSKADSTGYLPTQRPSAIKAVCTTFLKWLSSQLRRENPSRTLVISLFARAQSQYLFPGSAEHSAKHVLDDRQLIRWWARVLHPIFTQTKDDGLGKERSSDVQAYLKIPGYSNHELKSYFPPVDASSPENQQWIAGDPLAGLARTRKLPEDSPTRCLLPRFPDDPKARFAQDLDHEVGLSEDTATTVSPSKRKEGRWNSVRDLDRFWEAMEFRQECSSGRVVGFLWLVISPRFTLSQAKEKVEENRDSQISSTTLSSDSSLPTEDIPTAGQIPRKRRRQPLSGPVVTRQPRVKGESSNVSATSNLTASSNSQEANGLVLSKNGYDQTMQSLLHLDFANVEVAERSTNKWVLETARSCGLIGDWAVEIIGMANRHQSTSIVNANGSSRVNDLGGVVRKKRKVADSSTLSEEPAIAQMTSAVATDQPAVTILGGATIRKKPKPVA